MITAGCRYLIWHRLYPSPVQAGEARGSAPCSAEDSPPPWCGQVCYHIVCSHSSQQGTSPSSPRCSWPRRWSPWPRCPSPPPTPLWPWSSGLWVQGWADWVSSPRAESGPWLWADLKWHSLKRNLMFLEKCLLTLCGWQKVHARQVWIETLIKSQCQRGRDCL